MGTIVAFVSQKGGVGKSTLAQALAREAVMAGLATKLADLDTQQGTSVDWQRVRNDAKVEPYIEAQSYPTAAVALQMADLCDLLVIDAPARTSAGTLEIAKTADLVVQPTGASSFDLRPAVREFYGLIKKGIAKDKLAFALNRVGSVAEESEARGYLNEAGFAVLDGCLFERVAYRIAQADGHTITETKAGGLKNKADGLLKSLIEKVLNVTKVVDHE